MKKHLTVIMSVTATLMLAACGPAPRPHKLVTVRPLRSLQRIS